MQERKARHLLRRQGIAIADEHERNAASRRERRERGKIGDHEIGPRFPEKLVPGAEQPIDRGAIGEAGARQDVVEGRGGKGRALCGGTRMKRPSRRADDLVEGIPQRSGRGRIVDRRDRSNAVRREALRDTAHIHEMAEAATELPGEHDGLHRWEMLTMRKCHSIAGKARTGPLIGSS